MCCTHREQVEYAALNLLGGLMLLKWLLGHKKQDEVTTPTSGCLYGYGRGDDYFDKVYSLEIRIDELERQQDRCDILSDRYAELQDRIDDLQEKLNELEDYFDD